MHVINTPGVIQLVQLFLDSGDSVGEGVDCLLALVVTDDQEVGLLLGVRDILLQLYLLLL